MKRGMMNYLVDLGLFLGVVGLGLSGLARWPLPEGGGRGGWLARSRPWGLRRRTWREVHRYLGLAFLSLVPLHLALHWSWIVTTTRRLGRFGSGP